MDDDEDDYPHDVIRAWVWSGFHDEDAMQDMLSEVIADEGIDDDAVDALRAFIGEELARKAEAEAGWPAVTDCDRLDAVFASLSRQGIVALQNAGHTLDDGFADVAEVLHRQPKGAFIGYCFYHGQDLERAIAGEALLFAYADLQDTPAGKLRVGKLVQAALIAAGFACSWNGDPEQRIELPGIDWKRRFRI